MIDRRRFARTLAVLSAAVGKPFNEEQTEVYYSVLGSLPLASLEYAVQQTLRSWEFCALPPPGVLYKVAAPHARKLLDQQDTDQRLLADQQAVPLTQFRELLQLSDFGKLPEREESKAAARFKEMLGNGELEGE